MLVFCKLVSIYMLVQKLESWSERFDVWSAFRQALGGKTKNLFYAWTIQNWDRKVILEDIVDKDILEDILDKDVMNSK